MNIYAIGFDFEEPFMINDIYNIWKPLYREDETRFHSRDGTL